MSMSSKAPCYGLAARTLVSVRCSPKLDFAFYGHLPSIVFSMAGRRDRVVFPSKMGTTEGQRSAIAAAVLPCEFRNAGSAPRCTRSAPPKKKSDCTAGIH